MAGRFTAAKRLAGLCPGLEGLMPNSDRTPDDAWQLVES
jgi:hypothetical protein